MLYLIIPPIVIIISLVFLLFLLSRKKSEFYKIEKQNQENGLVKKSVIGKIKNADYSRINRFFLRLLEKITGKSKIFFLKFHNTTDRWSHLIRKKREKSNLNKENKQNVFDNKNEIKKSAIEAKVPAPIILNKEERIVPPMVSDKVANPESKTIIKNELERILIERIAVNPKDIEAYERLGDYYMEQKMFEDSKECYKQVLKLSPGHYQAKIRLRKISRELGLQ